MTNNDPDADEVVLATGTCGKCGHEIEAAPCKKSGGEVEKHIRCRACDGITVLRDFRPCFGGDPSE